MDFVNEMFLKASLKEQKNDNICPNCALEMACDGEYVCLKCGYMTRCVEKETHQLCNTRVSIKSGNRYKQHNQTNDSSEQRFDGLVEFFNKRHREFSGFSIPQFITQDVIVMYCNMQTDHKKENVQFRSPIREQVLSSMIYFMCMKNSMYRSRKEIAEFMGTPNVKSAQGDLIVRNLQGRKLIDVVVNEMPEVIAVRFFVMYNVDSKYSDFVREIVEMASRASICEQSMLMSKIIGSIRILLRQLRITLDEKQFETISGVQKNTYNKFCKVVMSAQHFCVFYAIFEKNGVPII